MKMQITFLGTGAVVPTESRNHNSILLNYKEESILIDCGEGTQRQFRKAKINPGRITRLLITHWHGDHILGLPGLFQTLALNKYQKTLYIYGPKGTKRYIEEIFKLFVHDRIKTEVQEVDGKFLETKDFYIIAKRLNHNAPCNGYSFVEKDKLRINKKIKKLKIKPEEKFKLSRLAEGKNIKINNKTIKSKSYTYLQKGKKISFILDTKITPNIYKLTENSDLAIIESTFLENSENGKKLAYEYLHLTAKQAAQIAKKSKAKQLILTHISQRYDNKEKLLLDEAKKVFKNTKIANDFMTVTI